MLKKFCSALLFCLIRVATAQAQDHIDSGPGIVIKGFGTAAFTMTDTNQAEFVRSYQAAGATTRASHGVDSNFGIQAIAKFNDWFSMTGQGLVRKTSTDRYTAELALAFFRMKTSDDFTLRIGRMGLPAYLISDFRHVGFASNMMRPPNEVYRQVPADTFDGADLVFQHSYGATTLTAQLARGHSEVRFGDRTGLEFKPVTALNLIVENGPLTVRLGHTEVRFSLLDTGLPSLQGALRANGFSAVADQLAYADVKGTFTGLGLGLDWNSFVVQAEYAVRKLHTRAVTDSTSWYAMLGYRYGKFTPYYYHGSTMQDSIRDFAGMPGSGPLAGLSAAANAAIKGAQFSNNAIGLRWDFNKSAAFKLQVDRVTPVDGTGGVHKAKPGFTGPLTVVAAGIDFIF